jgi:PhzF family phenazine biosynthesis protein
MVGHMSLPLFMVDAFASRPFEGNPAAVCLLDRERDAAWMQLVGREMNLSETAFLVPRGDGEFGLRWFTPAVEVDLCGHATLASAHVLFETKRVGASHSIRFHTKSGVLTATRDGEGIALDFPASGTEAVESPLGLEIALRCGRPVLVGRTRDVLLVELATEAEVRALSPDFTALARIDTRAFIVTARAASGSPFDFVSRFFAPRVGIDEDPVTGAAHCSLAAYWSPRLGKTAMTGFQASARGGVVRVRLEGARALLGGGAVTVSRGELLA